MKYSWKGHKDRSRHKNRIKRSGQARLVYVTDINRNIPTTWRWAGGDGRPSAVSAGNVNRVLQLAGLWKFYHTLFYGTLHGRWDRRLTGRLFLKVLATIGVGFEPSSDRQCWWIRSNRWKQCLMNFYGTSFVPILRIRINLHVGEKSSWTIQGGEMHEGFRVIMDPHKIFSFLDPRWGTADAEIKIHICWESAAVKSFLF